MSVPIDPYTYAHIIRASEVRDTYQRLFTTLAQAGFEEVAELDFDSFSYLILELLRSRLFRRMEEVGFPFEFDLEQADYDEHGNIVIEFIFDDDRAVTLFKTFFAGPRDTTT
jgi:5'-3' exonuclease